jgi:hypothetical protein
MELMFLRDAMIVAGKRHELLAVVVTQALTVKQSQVTQRRVGERRPDADVDQLNEARPHWEATVKLEPMEPELCIIKEMKRSIRNLLVLWCVLNLEVMITSIEPRKWIARAIILGKLQLVDHREILIIVVFSGNAATVHGHTHAQDPVPDRGPDAGESNVEGCLLLLLIGHRSLQCVDLIMQRLERPDNVFNGGEASDDILEHHLHVSSQTGGALAHGGSKTWAN